MDIITGQGLVGIMEGVVSGVGRIVPASDGGTCRGSFFKLFKALFKSDVPEIVQGGRLQTGVLTGQDGFQGGLSLAEFAGEQFPGSGIKELAGRGRGSRFRGRWS